MKLRGLIQEDRKVDRFIQENSKLQEVAGGC